ncbi:hypothetical protein B0H15DRAFT_1026715 [Mycena belliarum]|uniref:Uncharacterized protein n=1 Tax=Mycena belliarum TaxID=1033014 RepID=A0AAD6TVD0_9AGAR|nr:hypothetical protein B0H15DRAFT_1026715 [Mycena belliae]
MVTLESGALPSTSQPFARTACPSSYDPGLLSPPINTGKAPRSRSRTDSERLRQWSTRSLSAPPTQTTFIAPGPPSPATSVDNFGLLPALRPIRRSRTSFAPGYSSVAEGMTMRGGELVRPPPPLLRPTTFWRRAHRSGVAAASYSPSSHLIRRSTYITAGLSFGSPTHALSAFCVESRLTR